MRDIIYLTPTAGDWRQDADAVLAPYGTTYADVTRKMTHYARRLRWLVWEHMRHKRGMTHGQIARLCGVDASTVSSALRAVDEARAAGEDVV